MDIIIHRRDILPHNPCANGLDWFDDMVRMQAREDSLLVEGPLGLLWLYCNPESRDFAAWAQNKGVLPAFNGAGLNLSRANLRWADLRRANLQWANLQEANIRRANLQRANLQEADIRRADLYRACLEGARRRPEDPPIPGWKVVNGLLTKE